MKIIIPGRPVTKKNHSQIFRNPTTGKPFVAPSKQYTAYTSHAAAYLPPPGVALPSPPLNICCLYYMPTRHRVDLTNLLAATNDILVHYHVIPDDNCKIIGGHDGSRVYYDPEDPRTEITIEPLNEKSAA